MKKHKVALFVAIAVPWLVVCSLIRTNYKHTPKQEQLIDAYCQGWHDSERWKDEAPLTRELRFEVDSLCFKVKLLER